MKTVQNHTLCDFSNSNQIIAALPQIEAHETWSSDSVSKVGFRPPFGRNRGRKPPQLAVDIAGKRLSSAENLYVLVPLVVLVLEVVFSGQDVAGITAELGWKLMATSAAGGAQLRVGWLEAGRGLVGGV